MATTALPEQFQPSKPLSFLRESLELEEKSGCFELSGAMRIIGSITAMLARMQLSAVCV